MSNLQHRWRSILFVAMFLCACDGSSYGVEASPPASCLEKVAKLAAQEMVQIETAIGPADDLRWHVDVSVSGQIAEIELIPVSPVLRGGGGRYSFDCDSRDQKALTLVEGFR